MGLSAVVSACSGDAHFPIWLAAFATLGVGLAAGKLERVSIAGLRLPPLIVTLGTYSLYGAAEVTRCR